MSSHGADAEELDDIDAQIADLMDAEDPNDDTSMEVHADKESASGDKEDPEATDRHQEPKHDTDEGYEPKGGEDAGLKATAEVAAYNEEGANKLEPVAKTRSQGLAEDARASSTAAAAGNEAQAVAEPATSAIPVAKELHAPSVAGRRKKRLVARAADSAGRTGAPGPLSKTKATTSKAKVPGEDKVKARTESSRLPAKLPAVKKVANKTESKVTKEPEDTHDESANIVEPVVENTPEVVPGPPADHVDSVVDKANPKTANARTRSQASNSKEAPAVALTVNQAEAVSSVAPALKQQSAAPAVGRRKKIVARAPPSGGDIVVDASPAGGVKARKAAKPKVSAADIANAITEGSKQPVAKKTTRTSNTKAVKANAKPTKARAKSAYQIFSAEHRAAVEEEGITGIVQVSKRLGEMWGTLSDEEMKPYQDMAVADEQQLGIGKPDATSGKASITKAAKPTRCKTAYMRFCDANRKEFKDANPNATPGRITQLLAAAWKEATDDEKASFQAAYEEEKEKLSPVTMTAATHSSKRSPANDSDDITDDIERSLEEDDLDEERENVDWEEHPAEAILGSTLNHKLIVKRKGLPLTDYGLVDERLAKRSRMENTGSVVPSAMLTEYESWLSNFKSTVAENMQRGVLDLEDLPKDSPLESCYYLGKMAEANYMLSKAEKGKDAMKKYPVMALSMCVQRLLVIERQRACELEKKLHSAEEEILQLKLMMDGSKGGVAAVNAAEE